jgi:PBSX family phage terminase large subunit
VTVTTVKRSLHPGQSKAWRSEARFVSVIAGTGGGKTWFGPQWLYREMCAHPKEDYLVVAPTYGLLQRVTFPTFMSLMENVLPGITANYKAMERTLTLPTGGHVFFGSADRPITLEGVHVRAIWLDEAGQMKREAWEVCQRRIGHKQGRILITTTPYNMGWLKLEVYDRYKAGDPDYDIIQFPSYWNPSYSRDEYERAKKTLPDWKFSMFYDGKFTRASGLVYQDLDPAVHVVHPFNIPDSWPRYVGVDFGFTAPTAAVWGALDPDDRLYIYREYYQTGKLPEDTAKDIIDLSGKETIEQAFCDPEDPAAIVKYQHLGIRATEAYNTIKPGVIEVIGRLRTKRLFIFAGCFYTLDEAEQYKWRMKDDKMDDEPVHEYCHALDAVRYLVMGARGGSAPSVPVECASVSSGMPEIYDNGLPNIFESSRGGYPF